MNSSKSYHFEENLVTKYTSFARKSIISLTNGGRGGCIFVSYAYVLPAEQKGSSFYL